MTIPSGARAPSAAPVTAQLTFTPGRVIGAGQGTNSRVYLAHDHQLDAQLVIKELEKSTFTIPAEYYAEARRLYDARHRHVAELKFAAETTDRLYFAMPFYRNGSLQSVLDRRYLTVREIVRYGLEFLAGLHHVHVKGLVHFDVKPTNVLLDQSDTAALADFGLSREVFPTGLAPLPRFYRFHVPPERLTHDDVAKTADVYQAGVTLYRMCVGSAEYERQFRHYASEQALFDAIASGSFPDRRRRLAHIPARLYNIVRKAMMVDPSHRFSDALTLMNALAQVGESLDWIYLEGSAWGEGTWSESNQGRARVVTLTRRGAAWDVHASRRAASGREARCGQFCASSLTEAAARRLVADALSKRWQ